MVCMRGAALARRRDTRVLNYNAPKKRASRILRGGSAALAHRRVYLLYISRIVERAWQRAALIGFATQGRGVRPLVARISIQARAGQRLLLS